MSVILERGLLISPNYKSHALFIDRVIDDGKTGKDIEQRKGILEPGSFEQCRSAPSPAWSSGRRQGGIPIQKSLKAG